MLRTGLSVTALGLVLILVSPTGSWHSILGGPSGAADAPRMEYPRAVPPIPRPSSAHSGSGCTNCVRTSIAVGGLPETPVIDPTSGDLFVSNSGEDTVTVISPVNDSVLATLPVGKFPETPIVDPTLRSIYVPNLNSSTVTVVDGATLSEKGTISVGLHPYTGIYDPGNGDVYVPNFDSSNVSVIYSASPAVIADPAVGSGPNGIAYDPKNGELYVTNIFSGTVSVINGLTNQVIDTIDVGSRPYAPLYDPLDDDLYVPCYNASVVDVISGVSNQVVRTITVPPEPLTPAFDPQDSDIYLPSNLDGVLTVISGVNSTVLGRISIGSYSYTPAYDPANGDMYISNYGADNESVVLGMTHFATIAVGNTPDIPVYDPVDQSIYVSNWKSRNVSVIPGGGFLPLSVTASATPSSGPAWLQVYFQSFPVGGTGFYTNWSWHLAPGVERYQADVNYTYSTPGTYFAWVNVTDNNSATNYSAPVRITVTNITVKLVSILPGGAVVPSGGSTGPFFAQVTCTYLCPPSGIHYSWTLYPSGAGRLGTPTQNSTVFQAGSYSGLATLSVNATLDNHSVSSQAIVIKITPVPPPWWEQLFGAHGIPFLLAIASAIVGILLVWRFQRRRIERRKKTRESLQEVAS